LSNIQEELNCAFKIFKNIFANFSYMLPSKIMCENKLNIQEELNYAFKIFKNIFANFSYMLPSKIMC